MVWSNIITRNLRRYGTSLLNVWKKWGMGCKRLATPASDKPRFRYFFNLERYDSSYV